MKRETVWERYHSKPVDHLWFKSRYELIDAPIYEKIKAWYDEGLGCLFDKKLQLWKAGIIDQTQNHKLAFAIFQLRWFPVDHLGITILVDFGRFRETAN